MPKTPKFIIDMKSHPRSPKHGNRKPVAPTHGDPVDRTSSGKPIRTGLTTATWRTVYAGVPITRVATIPTIPFNLSPGAVNTIMPFPDPPSDLLRQMQEMMVQAAQELMVSLPDYTKMFLPNPKPPEIPHAGIRAGEIIGWRLWWVNSDGRLRSLIRDEIFWEPEVPMTGDVNKCVHISLRGPDRFGGVYCFNNLETAMNEFCGILLDVKNDRPAPVGVVGIILGTVKLWGEVVEHEGGYRASFAKPSEFLKSFYWDKGPSRDPYELYFGPRPAIDSSR